MLAESTDLHHANLTGIADNVLCAIMLAESAYLHYPNVAGIADIVLARLCSQMVRTYITQIPLASLTMPLRGRAYRK